MANGSILTNRAKPLIVTPTGNYSTTKIYAYTDNAFLFIGGYFSNSSNKSGSVASISGVTVPYAANLAFPCQCDDGSVKYVSLQNSGSDLIVESAQTLNANKYVRFSVCVPVE